MKFIFVNCKVCGEDIFNASNVVAFKPGPLGLTPIEMHGQQPWCGMFCICRGCIKAISKVRDEIQTN